jgi:hypothetical protein
MAGDLVMCLCGMLREEGRRRTGLPDMNRVHVLFREPLSVLWICIGFNADLDLEICFSNLFRNQVGYLTAIIFDVTRLTIGQ